MDSTWFNFDNYETENNTASPLSDDSAFVTEFLNPNKEVKFDQEDYLFFGENTDLDLDEIMGTRKNKMKDPLITDDLLSSASNTKAAAAFFSQENIDASRDISLTSILNSNSTFVVNSATMTIGAPTTSTTTNTRGGHQRKPTLGHRVVAPSPAYNEAVDVKPDIESLGIAGRTRKRNSSSISSLEVKPPTPTSNKKPRKYEIDDPSDPSVRNAIAAKMNREKKKTEFSEMKIRAETAEAQMASLQSVFAQLEKKFNVMKANYDAEREKNRTAIGVQRKMTTMKHVFEAIIPAMNQKFGRPISVEVPDYFKNIPAVIDENGQLATIDATELDLHSGSFNILDESFQMQEDCHEERELNNQSDYITLHVNPQGGKIRLDYDPSKFVEFLKNFKN